MDNIEQDIPKKELPFNNLFLNSAVVHGFNYWWMYFFGIAAVLLGYVICQLLITFPLMTIAFNNGVSMAELQSNPLMLFDPAQIGINNNILLAMLFSMFGFALLGLFIVVKRIHHKTFLSILTAYSKLRYKRLFFAFLVWGILIIVATLISYFTVPGELTVQFKPGSFLGLLLVCIVLLPIQTSAEEIIIRGYLMQGLALIFKNGIIPLILTSLLFGFLHMENPEAREFGWMVMLPYYATFGLFLGLITLLDEGLELALGIHLANNFISCLLVTTPNGTLRTDAIFLTQTQDPKSEFILFIVLAIITFAVFWFKYRWTNFKLILK
ncbi:MAG: CPBP family intramembrane metalloprotease [Bacteroidetes bacterium]|nr:CPBP family intramembrane metalloprotease [Bacteroidota bacterium]